MDIFLVFLAIINCIFLKLIFLIKISNLVNMRPCSSVVKKQPAIVEDVGSIPGLG